MPAIKLPCVFTDHAVLQHSRQAPLWGWTDPAAHVTVSFRGQHLSAVADSTGKFTVKVPTGTPGGPFELIIQCGDICTTINDVLVGEVWLCSGQSNMEWPLRDASDGDVEIAQARHTGMRLLHLPQTTAVEPASDINAKWACCIPTTAAAFSAIGYHFGKYLHQQLHVPIGLIQSAWGGTTAEAWTSREALLSDSELAYLTSEDLPIGPYTDPGIAPECSMWASADADESSWALMSIPQTWQNAGLNFNGVVWFRKSIDIPAEWAGKSLILSLGIIDDTDTTFFNGEQIGATGLETPNFWEFKRRYIIPGHLVKPGKTNIAVRVFDQWGAGGLIGKEPMYLATEENEQNRIAIDGIWLYRVELALQLRTPGSTVPPMSLFNAMINPLVPFSIVGSIWYQGESNVDRAYEYRKLFATMINCWRSAWKDEFAFLFVLLAGFHAHANEPDESLIAELRDAQLSVLNLPRTAVASAIDLGDIEDIHPRNKRDVGLRLAYAALATCYSQNTEYIGPTFTSASLHGRTAILHFDHASGLHSCGEGLPGFTTAGDDLTFHNAEASVENETVILKSTENIRFIRYNWADNPLGNLYNAAGLPMLPFRTDIRPYTTAPVAEVYGRHG